MTFGGDDGFSSVDQTVTVFGDVLVGFTAAAGVEVSVHAPCVQISGFQNVVKVIGLHMFSPVVSQCREGTRRTSHRTRQGRELCEMDHVL
jgi:hypothetical protein